MNTLFVAIQLFVSILLFLVAVIIAAGGDWLKATFYMTFACNTLLIFLVLHNEGK